MMEAYRITRNRYAQTLNASGFENRWNIEGDFVIYAAQNRSLVILEMVAHRNALMKMRKYKLLTLQLPDDKKTIKSIHLSDLPEDWGSFTGYGLTQKIGAQWYADKTSLVLKVPSLLVPQEHNFIINTRHPAFDQVEIACSEDYVWDKRLLES